MAEELPFALEPRRFFHEHYEVVRAIRTGGMGAIYEVIHRPTRRRRALKVMLPALVADAEMVARFELEARVTADVESEHIVETFDAGVDAATGLPFLVMELLRGEDLGAMMKRGAPLSPAQIVTLLRQAALALERTHAAGIVHRDLKPENLFLTERDDGSPLLKVLDFGIAKLVAQSTQSMRTTRSVGTPLYMSPEQVRGDGSIDERADLYSLAHIAFALLVKHAYWETEARASENVYPLLLKIANGAKGRATVSAAAWGVTLPDAFDDWFAKATSPAPADRFESAREMIDELARTLASGPVVTDAGARRADDSGQGVALAASTGLSVSLPRRTEGARFRGLVGPVVATVALAVIAVLIVPTLASKGGPPPASASAASAPPIVSETAAASAPATAAPSMTAALAPTTAAEPATEPTPVPNRRAPRPAPASAPRRAPAASAPPPPPSDPSDTR